MAPLSLKIVLDNGAVTRKVKFNSSTTIAEAHDIVKEKVTVPDDGREYGLFLRSADDELSGVWLEGHHTLDYYMLRDGDSLDYICKIRNLRVRLLDGTVKTIEVNQAKTINTLMAGICARIGITNHEEYGLCHEDEGEMEEGKETKQALAAGTLTLKRKAQQKGRDVQLEELSKKLKTDDNVDWLDQHKTLRELGVDPQETLLLKRRLFYSDRNVDSRDPVQLNLLYVQTRDSILNGTHPVTEEQAADCKVRWVNIRDVHRRLLRKKMTEPNNSSKPYKYEKEISFMRAYYRDVTPLLAPVDDDDEDGGDDNDNKTYGQWIEGDEVPQTSDSTESEERKKKPLVVRRKSKRKKQERVYEDEKPITSSFTSSFVETAPSDFDPSDPVDAFLLSIGATLKTFSPYHLNLAKSKIFSVVQEHDLQQIMQKQPNDIKVSASDTLYLNE